MPNARHNRSVKSTRIDRTLHTRTTAEAPLPRRERHFASACKARERHAFPGDHCLRQRRPVDETPDEQCRGTPHAEIELRGLQQRVGGLPQLVARVARCARPGSRNRSAA